MTSELSEDREHRQRKRNRALCSLKVLISFGNLLKSFSHSSGRSPQKISVFPLWLCASVVQKPAFTPHTPIDTSELGTGDYHLVWRRLARVAHWPRVDQAELVGAPGANSQLGNGVVEAVSNRQTVAVAILVFPSDPGEPDQQYNGLVVGDLVYS